MNYFLHVRDNVNYYKRVHHPIPTRENRKHPGNFQNKLVSSAFDRVSRCIISLAKVKVVRREAKLYDYPQEQFVVRSCEKVSPFVKFEIIRPLLCFL